MKNKINVHVKNKPLEYFYYIENCGCDDTTYGLIKCSRLISDSIFLFNLFLKEIDQLNKNSSYSCQPVILIYKIPDSFVREATSSDPGWRVIHTSDGDLVLKESLDYYDEFAQDRVLKEGVIRIL